MFTHVTARITCDFLKKPFQGELQPICYLLDRPLYFRPERELAGSDFHRRKDRALQGTHNNIAENAILLVALGRRNWLFVGSESGGENAAIMYTLMVTCKLNGIDPEAYLRYVIGEISDWPSKRLKELRP